MKTFGGKSDSQKSSLVKLHKESWIKINGVILDAGLDGWGAISFFMSPTADTKVARGNLPVHASFDKPWAKAVSLLAPGTAVTVIGQPYMVVGDILYIVHSEIMAGD